MNEQSSTIDLRLYHITFATSHYSTLTTRIQRDATEYYEKVMYFPVIVKDDDSNSYVHPGRFVVATSEAEALSQALSVYYDNIPASKDGATLDLGLAVRVKDLYTETDEQQAVFKQAKTCGILIQDITDIIEPYVQARIQKVNV